MALRREFQQYRKPLCLNVPSVGAERKIKIMEKLIKILTERDGITLQTAKRLILETKEALMNSKACDGADIIQEYLGLEPDYIIDILDVSDT